MEGTESADRLGRCRQSRDYDHEISEIVLD
jgi:hypothetical protein